MKVTHLASNSKQFLLGRNFSDGLKMTLGLLLPAVLFYQFERIEEGIILSLGALCVALVDNPGPWHHRRNAMLIALPLLFFASLFTGLVNSYPWLLALLIGFGFFFFSMFSVFGARAGALGTSVLIIMVLLIDDALNPREALITSTLVISGGIWYTLLSFSLKSLWPYRAAEQALGESIVQVATYFRIKAGFYKSGLDLKKQQQLLIDHQIIVHQHFDHARELFFTTRKDLRDPSPISQQLMLVFVDMVDLYDQTTASHFDYAQIQARFGSLGILDTFEGTILGLAKEIDRIGLAYHNHENLQPIYNLEARLNLLKRGIDALEEQQINVLILKKILVNLRNISQRIERIYSYSTSKKSLQLQQGLDSSRFVSTQRINWQVLQENITFKSSIFRHSLRVALVCMATYLMMRAFFHGQHSYWILLTVLVILKPSFSLTKQRNYQRLVGTIAGGLLGALLLWFIQDPSIRFILLVVCMLLSYSYMRLHYGWSVFFLTPFILLIFSFTTNLNDWELVKERIIDTLIGSGIAALSSYFIFPVWEGQQLKAAMVQMIRSNAQYLIKAITRNSENWNSVSEYRLARKEMYVAQSNLASIFQKILSEPKQSQLEALKAQQFTVLSHLLSSYMATFSYQWQLHPQMNEDQIRLLRISLHTLKEMYQQLQGENWNLEEPDFQNITLQENPIIEETLQMLQRTAQDLKKSL